MHVNKIVLHGWQCLASGRTFNDGMPMSQTITNNSHNSLENCISLGHRYENKYNIKQNGTIKVKG